MLAKQQSNPEFQEWCTQMGCTVWFSDAISNSDVQVTAVNSLDEIVVCFNAVSHVLMFMTCTYQRKWLSKSAHLVPGSNEKYGWRKVVSRWKFLKLISNSF